MLLRKLFAFRSGYGRKPQAWLTTWRAKTVTTHRRQPRLQAGGDLKYPPASTTVNFRQHFAGKTGCSGAETLCHKTPI